MLFGEINYNAKYTDCIIDGDKNLIDINVGLTSSNTSTIYAGGYVGSGSTTLQTLTNRIGSFSQFVDNLYILIGNGYKFNAGLLFGEAVMFSNGNGSTAKNNENLSIEISGLISNKYTFNGDDLIERTPMSVVAEVGGVVGSGSGNLCGIIVNGLFIDTDEEIGADNYVLIDLQTSCEDLVSDTAVNFGTTKLVKIGGMVGNASAYALYLNSVDVYGDIIVANDGLGNQLLLVGGIVGYTGNSYEIYKAEYLNNDYISNILISESTGVNTITYAGGIVGFSYTEQGDTFKIGENEGGISNGCTFEGNLDITRINKLYVGGIIGATSDALKLTVSKKITVYDSLVSGNINLDSSIAVSSIIVGGVAGIVAADLENSYAWGNIKTNLSDENTINNLYLGGIVGQLKGLSYQKSQFYSNYSMTSIYNIYRGETTHNVKALIGDGSNFIVGDGLKLSYYCHQINLCTDTIGSNLYYNTGKSGTGTILAKFDSQGLVENMSIGSKLNPQKINQSNYASTTFDSGKYYVLNADISASVSKDIAGHLIGDGYKLATTSISPFNDVSGAVSGLFTQCTYTNNGAIGFASENTGIIFAVTSRVELPLDKKLKSGFVVENTGLIADCGTVIFGSSADSGFCELNAGVIQNCFATGSLIVGVDNTSESNKKGVFAGSSGTGADEYSNTGKIVNCYVALKSGSSVAAFYGANISNCYYDRNAAEKDFGTSPSSIIRKNTTDMSILSINTTSFISNLGANWTQKYYQNFGYPTLSVGAYEKFGYLCENFNTGNGTTSNESDYIQIPNAGKLQQINEITSIGTITSLSANYVLTNNINIDGAGYNNNDDDGFDEKWAPIGTSSSSFSGIFNGNNYTISNLIITSTGGYNGLFGYIGGNITGTRIATVCNLTLEGVSFTLTNSTYAGSIVGYSNRYSLIENCSSSGTIAIINNPNSIGGIVGYIKNTTQIKTCSSGIVYFYKWNTKLLWLKLVEL